MKNNNQSKKLPGFYIALCCCVIAIGAAGFFLQQEDKEPEITQTAMYEAEAPEHQKAQEVYIEEEITVPTILPVPTEVVQDSEVMDYAYDNPDVVSASVVVNAEEEHKFSDPLPEMTVLFGFTNDALMYNEAYGDWRAHNGVDLKAELGCSVSAVADGTVTDVSEGSYGKTVTIEHADGFKSVYSQLGDININIGDTITQGAVIGTVGESRGENIKDSHLHFAILKDGKPLNPEEY